MKSLIFIIISLLVSDVFAICETHTKCEFKLPIQKNFFKYYSSHNLESSDAKIERLVIVVHGAGRNGNEYFDDTVIAAKKLNVQNKTIVLAPTFRKVTDTREPNEVFWGRKWFTKWKYGYESQDETKISSFEIIDILIRNIANSGKFKNLKEVVLTGHSAGGQFTQRYAFGTKVDLDISQKLTIIPSNPSSYLYLDNIRYLFKDGNFIEADQNTLCNGYNEYIYGPINRAKYLEKFDIKSLRDNFKCKNIILLMSEDDKGIDSLDRSCEAIAQGINRIERAQNFYHYSKKFLTSKSHQFASIPEVGHDHVAVYESQQAKEHVFGIKKKNDPSYLLKRYGKTSDIVTKTQTHFALLGGGKNEPVGMSKFISAANGGDLLVVSGKSQLNHRYTFDFNRLASEMGVTLNSIKVVSFLNRSAGENKDVIDLLLKAEAVFFTGGDQSKYIDRVKGTTFHKTLLKKVGKGVAVGGTSAGLAIMGEFIFSAKNGGVSSRYVLKNPMATEITIEHEFFEHPFLNNVITDTHFSERNREGRLLGFIYRARTDFNRNEVTGVGIDEHTSLTIDKNNRLEAFGSGDVYIYKLDSKITRSSTELNLSKVRKVQLSNRTLYPGFNELIFEDVISVINGNVIQK